MALHSKVSNGRVPSASVAILVGLITLAVFLPALQNGFVNWDDDANLVNNPNFRGFDWDHLRWMWTNHLGARYIPLTWMSFGLDYVVWQGDKFGYHLTNIVLHAANAALFYLLTLAFFKRTFAPSGAPLEGAWRAGAIFSALFFALHPLRVESVAWVTERRDVLSGIFFILLLLVYLRCFPQEHTGPEIDRKGYWICLTLFIMAILSKEIVVTVPVILLLLDIYPLRRLGGGAGRWFGRGVRNVWLEKLPFFAIAFADSVMAIYVAIQGHLVEPVGVLGWMDRIAISVYGMAFYVRKTVLPLGLSPFYPVTLLKINRGATPFQLSVALVLGLTLIALLLRRRFPALLAVWIAFAVILLPVGGIIHNGLQIAADRYTYLACLGFAMLAGALVSHVWKALQRYRMGAVLVAGLASLLLIGLSFLTQKQIAVWRDSDTLWAHAIAIEPSFVAHLNQGSSMVNEGDSSGAIVHLRQAIEMWPKNAAAHSNLGKAFLDLKDWEDAAGEFRRVIQLAPAPAAYNSLAHALAMQGKLDEAIASLREALRMAPDDAVARGNLDAILALKTRQQ